MKWERLRLATEEYGKNMKLMLCPLNGWRGIEEFSYGGEWRESPNPDYVDDEMWSAHVFLHENSRGPTAEWWCHLPSAYWFIAIRDTASGAVIETFTTIQWIKRLGIDVASKNGQDEK